MLAYLSLGSNLGDREKNLREAIEELGAVKKVSSFYETDPVDMAADSPRFLNCAVALETEQSPADLLHTVLDIERRLGRVRTTPNASRTIDIDILLYGDQVISTPELTIPHPRMTERRFVLDPLTEIAPDLRHPETGERLQ